MLLPACLRGRPTALAHSAAMEADPAAADLPAGPWADHFANPYAFEVGDLVWIGDDRPVAAAFGIPPPIILLVGSMPLL